MAEPVSLRDEILGEKTGFETFVLFTPRPELPGTIENEAGDVEVLPPPTVDDLIAYQKLLEGQAADLEANVPKDATAAMLAVRAEHVAELRAEAATFAPDRFEKRTFKYRRPLVSDRTTVQRLAGVKLKGKKKDLEEQEFDPSRFAVAVAIVTLCDENGQALFTPTEFDALLAMPEDGLGGRALTESARRYGLASSAGKASARRRTFGSSSNSRGR